MQRCPNCKSSDIDMQESSGQSICVNCGTVLEENTIVSSIEFQELGDRSHVVGQFVSASSSKPFSSGARGSARHGDPRGSRDTTLMNARRAISQVASNVRLPQAYVDRAYRLYQLALNKNFTFGRRQTHIVATCLYIICRQEKSPHLLIDFSDALQVNVFVLGKAFLQFAQIFNLSLPVVDPSLYIHRFATRLNFEDKLSVVVTAALRIVTRMKKDWIETGRRPDGVCAAALLIAARAFKFNVGQAEIAKIFRITNETLKSRLTDFRATPSAQLTLEQFNMNDIELAFDPPSYINNKVAQLKAANTAAGSDSDDDCNRDDDDNDNDENENRSRTSSTKQQHLRLNLPGLDGDLSFTSLVEDSVFKQQKGVKAIAGNDGDDDEDEGDDEEKEDDDDQALAVLSAAADRFGVKQQPTSSSSVSSSTGAATKGKFVTKIGDVSVTVPVPGIKVSKPYTSTYKAKSVAKAQMYQDIYAETLQAVELQHQQSTGASTSSSSVRATRGRGSKAAAAAAASSRSSAIVSTITSALMKESEEVVQSLLKQKKMNAVRLVEPKQARTVKIVMASTAAEEEGKTKAIDSSSSSTNANRKRGPDGAMVVPPGKRSGGETSGRNAGVVEEEEEQDEETIQASIEDIIPTDELDEYILNPEEQQKRSTIWEANFRTFVDERNARKKVKEQEARSAAERFAAQGGSMMRKKYARKGGVGAGTGGGMGGRGFVSGGGGVGNSAAAAAFTGGASSSASSAVLGLVAGDYKGSSKKINYEALKGVFGDDGGFVAPSGMPSSSGSSSTSVVGAAGGLIKPPPLLPPSGMSIRTRSGSISGSAIAKSEAAAAAAAASSRSKIGSLANTKKAMAQALLQQQQQQQAQGGTTAGTAAGVEDEDEEDEEDALMYEEDDYGYGEEEYD